MIQNLHIVPRKLWLAFMLVFCAVGATPAFAGQKNKQPAPKLPDGRRRSIFPTLCGRNLRPLRGSGISIIFLPRRSRPRSNRTSSGSPGWIAWREWAPNEAAKRAGTKPRFALGTPYGLAVDSKGMLYVADTKVGAVFIFDPENKDTGFIKHGVDAKFGRIFGLAIDDADRLFVSDGEYNHILVFNKEHKLEGQFGDGVLNDPAGMAIDEENRFLYVANTGTDKFWFTMPTLSSCCARSGRQGRPTRSPRPVTFPSRPMLPWIKTATSMSATP